uniref:Uncharacterized protein n=1 Tax=Aplanochytrium stocchinoi TaxID=215587 RepID=A0A7S3V3M0_9STRA|mmetsp:Transcript_17757/g.21877  ORF Transcript_17757/g.21877 Transcript_17757/m.21877 type:complete len:228 (+) Transcript_17757:164-847(+)
MISPALLLSGGVIGSYLIGYTAYSKTNKTLEWESLKEVVCVKKGLDHTAVQLNKVLALSGLTQLGLAFIPGAMDTIGVNQQDLAALSTYMLVSHGAYSIYRYYASAKMPRISTFPRIFTEAFSSAASTIEKLMAKRKFALLCGTACSALMYAYLLDDGTYIHSRTKVPVDALQEHAPEICGVLSLGLLHFYFMEVDAKGALPVRPYGLLALITPSVALAFAAKYVLV